MPVHLIYREESVRAELIGEIDDYTARQMREAIDPAISRLHPKKLILDFSAVPFMDSSGIAVIIRARKRMWETGGKIWLIRPGAQPLRVLETSGLERFIQIKCTESGGVR